MNNLLLKSIPHNKHIIRNRHGLHQRTLRLNDSNSIMRSGGFLPGIHQLSIIINTTVMQWQNYCLQFLPSLYLIRHFIDLIDILFIAHMEGSYCPAASIGAAMCHGVKRLVTLHSDSFCLTETGWHIQ